MSDVEECEKKALLPYEADIGKKNLLILWNFAIKNLILWF